MSKKPDEGVLLENLGKIAYTLDKEYANRLEQDYRCAPFEGINCPPDKDSPLVSYSANIRGVKIRRWVFDKDEKIGDCFKNAMSTFADGDHTIALMVTRTHEATSMDFIVKNVGQGRNEDSGKNQALLKATLQGNFPGSEVEDIKSDTTETKVGEIIDKYNHISILMNSPSEYSKDYITQGLDKLLDGVVPESNEEGYTVVFLAESISMASIREILTGYEQLATAIHPFLSYQFNEGTSEDSTQSESETLSNFSSVSNTISKTHSVNFGINAGISRGSSETKSPGWLFNVFRTIWNVAAKTIFESTSLGLSAGYGYSWGTAKTETTGESQASTKGSSISFGKTEGATYTYQSYTVSNLLNRLENVMKGITESQATGLWKYATYILAEDSATCTSVASYLRGITQGKESHLESSAIQTWCYEGEDDCEFSKIKNYVRHFCHPIFVTKDGEGQPIAVTPTNYVATDKLSNVMIFPRKSMQGLPVLEGVSFGRDPHGIESITEDFEIGFCYHMFTPSKNRLVKLSKDSLTSHTFVTGSTGSGKSNTVYQLLEELRQKGVKFLVVEPAKGEYKEVLGGLPDVSVYGTNPQLTPLLRINPFSFPHGNGEPSRNIHILEHLDRLVELFNVCWPMYAAMPAVLKEAVEKSYEDCGWNLTESTNPYGDNLYPTFADVTRNIRTIIDSSEYDAENKGAYKGALVTRLKSLTNGINGLIFTTNELSAQELFDRNVIVDLSRVGSAETKSLIMGLLVLKLQEHRMTTKGLINSPLCHVTVLEEAHNLLKRTSTEQSQDSGNLLGKSVEMLANSIAEMRTYGEGFIIADQAPGLLDLSVIRNTNTKIIMRLPDQDDRELVGRAANLNDDQITELARLPVGVAAVYQNNWIEPVLCQVEKYGDKKKFEYQRQDDEDSGAPGMQRRLELARLLCNAGDEKQLREPIENELKGSCLNGSVYVAVKQYMAHWKKTDYDKLSLVVSQLLPEFSKTVRNAALRNPHDIHIWRDDVQEHIEKELRECDFQTQEQTALRNSILQCILQNYVLAELNSPSLLKELNPRQAR